MKRQGRTKFFIAWLLIAALTLPPLTGVAEAGNYKEGSGTVGEGVDNAISISPDGGEPSNVGNSGGIAIGSGAVAATPPMGALTLTAVGTEAKATGQDSSVFGGYAHAEGNYSSAFGVNAYATGADSSAFGHDSNAASDASSAFGSTAQATGLNSSAFGAIAQATGLESSAFGFASISESNNSIALGAYSYVNRTTGNSGIYVPSGSVAKTIEDTVIGTQGVVSIGDLNGQNTMYSSPGAFTRQLTGLAAGIEDTDAVNVAQLKALEDVSVNYVDASKKDSIVLGNGNGTSSISNVTAMSLASAGKFAATTGQVYNVGKGTADALGGDFELNENGNITGNFAYRSNPGLNTVQSVFDTISGDVTANETNIELMGEKTASALGGKSSYKDGTLTTKLTVGNVEYSTVQGALTAVDDIAVKYDTEQGNSITLKGSGGTTISGLKDADISSTSTQAVSGKQLFAVSTDVATNISSLSRELTAVSDDLGSRISTNERDIGNLQESDKRSLKYDETNENSVTLVGADENSKVTLKNVAAGAEGDEAVNVSQLNDALGILGNGAAIDDTNGTITKNDFAYRSNAGLDTVQKVFNAVSGDVTANETKIKDIGGVLGEGYVKPTFTSVTISNFEVKQNTAGDGLDM
ncbi:hypothetical protein, partial [Cloacibacillus porcorum]